MAEVVYMLCAVTSAACALLLIRAYRRNRIRLLFWSAFCFVALAVNNVVVFIDLIIVPQTDLSAIRSLAALVGLGALLFTLLWQ